MNWRFSHDAISKAKSIHSPAADERRPNDLFNKGSRASLGWPIIAISGIGGCPIRDQLVATGLPIRPP